MLETRTIIDRVQQRDYPPDWRVYRGRGKWGKAILSIIGYGCGFYAGISILFTIVLLIFAFSTPELGDTTFATFLSAGIFFLFVAGITGIAIYVLRKAHAKAMTLLVILPDGVVLCSESRPEKTYTFAFADIARIDFGNHTFPRTPPAYWLDLYMRDGHYLKWPLNDAFDEPDEVGKNIIAAHLYYGHQL